MEGAVHEVNFNICPIQPVELFGRRSIGLKWVRPCGRQHDRVLKCEDSVLSDVQS